MSTNPPEIISESNLSHAWGKAFLVAMTGRNDLAPLTISIDGLTNGLPAEDERIRKTLDLALGQNGKYAAAISAMTIFPFKFWNLNKQPHVEEFSELYLRKYLPRLRARDPRNRKGTYFERMISFQGVRKKRGTLSTESKNQLLHIVSLWPKEGKGRRPRRSALQVAIFDPVKDHNGSPRSVFLPSASEFYL